MAAACLYPMLYVLFASFSNSNQLMRHTGILLWPQGFSTGAYEMVFKNPMIARGYLNTMFVLVMSLILQITLTSLGAYFLSRRNVMFQKPIMLLITFTNVLLRRHDPHLLEYEEPAPDGQPVGA